MYLWLRPRRTSCPMVATPRWRTASVARPGWADVLAYTFRGWRRRTLGEVAQLQTVEIPPSCQPPFAPGGNLGLTTDNSAGDVDLAQDGDLDGRGEQLGELGAICLVVLGHPVRLQCVPVDVALEEVKPRTVVVGLVQVIDLAAGFSPGALDHHVERRAKLRYALRAGCEAGEDDRGRSRHLYLRRQIP